MKNKNKYKQLTFAPFCYSTPSISSSSWMVLFLLLPQIVMLFITKARKKGVSFETPYDISY